jgi:hypothetical protein
VRTADAIVQRAEDRTASLHARWHNLGAIDSARVLVATQTAEHNNDVANELTKAIIDRAKALVADDADTAELCEAIGAAA